MRSGEFVGWKRHERRTERGRRVPERRETNLASSTKRNSPGIVPRSTVDLRVELGDKVVPKNIRRNG